MILSSVIFSSTDYDERLANEIQQRDFALPFKENANYSDNYFSSCSSDEGITKSRVSQEDVPFILIPHIPESPKIHKFESELEYEGVVLSINEEERLFTARIVSTKSANSEEEGEFSLDDLDGDENLVMPGAVFTWVVGLQSRGKSKQRVSDIRFRRHAALPREMIIKAESKARELSKFFSHHESNKPITLIID